MEKLVITFGLIILLSGCLGGSPPDYGKMNVTDVTAARARELIGENEDNGDFIILDVRAPGEYAQGHIEGAVNVDYDSRSFKDELTQLGKDETYLVYYRTGRRSSGALKVMGELGFKNVYHMNKGITDWTGQDYSLANQTCITCV